MKNPQHIGYIRVSTQEQNTSRQLADLRPTLGEVFTDHVSGRSTEGRPALAAMMRHVRRGDTLFVDSIDRLARNSEDLLRICRELDEKGVTVEFVSQRITLRPVSDDPKDRMVRAMTGMILTVFGAVAQMDRVNMLERQRGGIELAKKAGKYTGRKPKLDPVQIAAVRARCAAGEEKSAVARSCGISRMSLYRYLSDAA